MHELPDVEILLQRARTLADAGEAWRARRKLRTWLAQFPFDARWALLLGELELQAGEFPAAGRWLWLAESADPAHRPAVDLFLSESTEQDLWNALPKSLRRGRTPVPARVQAVLTERGVPIERRIQRAQQLHPVRASGVWESVASGALGLALLGVFAHGAWKLIEFLVAWWG